VVQIKVKEWFIITIVKVKRFGKAFCNYLSCINATFLPMCGNKYSFKNSLFTFSECGTLDDGILAHFKQKPDN
jgi:hypothetical protein